MPKLRKMLYLALIRQLAAFDSEIYKTRQKPSQRILLLTSEAVGQCLLERAIAIAKRNTDPLGNAYEPTPISRVGHEIVFNNGSLIQYAGDRLVHHRLKYHTIFWQLLTPQQLTVKPSPRATLSANVLAPDGLLIEVSEAIAQFYARS